MAEHVSLLNLRFFSAVQQGDLDVLSGSSVLDFSVLRILDDSNLAGVIVGHHEALVSEFDCSGLDLSVDSPSVFELEVIKNGDSERVGGVATFGKG